MLRGRFARYALRFFLVRPELLHLVTSWQCVVPRPGCQQNFDSRVKSKAYPQEIRMKRLFLAVAASIALFAAGGALAQSHGGGMHGGGGGNWHGGGNWNGGGNWHG